MKKKKSNQEEEADLLTELIKDVEADLSGAIRVIDKTEETGIDYPVKLVKLHETKTSYIPGQKLPEPYKENTIGLIPAVERLKAGIYLNVYLTSTNGKPDYRWASFSTPLEQVMTTDRYTYFQLQGRFYRIEFYGFN